MFQLEQARIAYLISHLTGQAEAWAKAERARRSPICESYSRFSQAFTQIFQSFSPGQEAAHSLISLCQGHRTVLDYAIEFRTLAGDSGWNNTALTDAFLSGLSHKIKDQLVSLDVPEALGSVLSITNKTDRGLKERERRQVYHFSRRTTHE